MTAGRIWAASLAIVLGSLAVVAVWHHPALFLWYLAVAALVVIAALAIAADHFRHQRDEAREERDLMERECDAHAAENARLTRSEAVWRNQNERMRATFVGGKGTRLRLVEATDALPIADGDFPVHDRIDDADLTALMRATEEKR